ncbi:MAG: ABC transporter ATP-binding protein [Lautropia sp.]|nr:ABC transporter ATP-binding protein [Lautropia sp.]
MSIRCDRVCLRDGARDVLRALSLDVPLGSPLVIVGPSGAGKSVLFRVLAGQLRPHAGRLQIHGREVVLNGLRTSQVALIHACSTNYPDFSVWGNIAVPFRLAQARLVEEQVILLAHEVGLGTCLDLMPAELSPLGQRRLALARAMATRPALLLIDDPLAGLSETEAALFLDDLPGICAAAWQHGIATVVGCRSSQVALAFGGPTAVMAQGRLQQQEAQAIDVLLRPVSLNVARVFGDPPINLLRGVLHQHTVMIEHGPAVPLIEPLKVEDPNVLVGIRPEDMRLQGGLGDLSLQVRVEQVLCSVNGTRLACRGRAGPVTVSLPSVFRPSPGETVTLYVDPGALYLFDGAGALVQQPERSVERANRAMHEAESSDEMPVDQATTIFAWR